MKSFQNEIEIMYKGSFLYTNRLLNKWSSPTNDHKIKSELVHEFRLKFQPKILVETGTYLGEMVYDQMMNFEQVHSIELSEYYYRIAKKRFKNYQNVFLYFGDSSELLEKVISKITSPALFWLDGHYSEGKTAKGNRTTPLWTEIKVILSNPIKHIILIDDARLILDKSNLDYPDVEYIEEIISNSDHKMNLEIRSDIVCIYPYNL